MGRYRKAAPGRVWEVKERGKNIPERMASAKPEIVGELEERGQRSLGQLTGAVLGVGQLAAFLRSPHFLKTLSVMTKKRMYSSNSGF